MQTVNIRNMTNEYALLNIVSLYYKRRINQAGLLQTVFKNILDTTECVPLNDILIKLFTYCQIIFNPKIWLTYIGAGLLL